MTVGLLFALAYLVPPIVLVWGWFRWLRVPLKRTAPAVLSLIGFLLATLSALLAVTTIAYDTNSPFSLFRPAAASDISVGCSTVSRRRTFWYLLVFGDRVLCAGTRLPVHWRCSPSG